MMFNLYPLAQTSDSRQEPRFESWARTTSYVMEINDAHLLNGKGYHREEYCVREFTIILYKGTRTWPVWFSFRGETRA